MTARLKEAAVGERLAAAIAETLFTVIADLDDADARLERAVDAILDCFDIDRHGNPTGRLVVTGTGGHHVSTMACTVHGNTAVDMVDHGDGLLTFTCGECSARREELL